MSTEKKDEKKKLNIKEITDGLKSGVLKRQVEVLDILNQIDKKEAKLIPKELLFEVVQTLKNSEKKILTNSLISAINHVAGISKRTNSIFGEIETVGIVSASLLSLDETLRKNCLNCLYIFSKLGIYKLTLS
jgi:DNA phosphorothioation-dependent restriction protein DptG